MAVYLFVIIFASRYHNVQQYQFTMNKSIIVTFVYLFLFSFCSSIFAQDDDCKIFISTMNEVYRYELNKVGGMEVKGDYVINYKCLKPSTATFVEYYDDDSEIKNMKIKGVKGVKPYYGMYKRENVFFSDSKVCSFDIPFIQKDSDATVTYSKIYKDARLFLVLPLAERYYTKDRTITLEIPDGLDVDILKYNLSDNVAFDTIRDDGKKTIRIVIHISNQPEYILEAQTPSYLHNYPYIMAVPRAYVDGKRNIQYFQTLSDLYNWSKEPLSLMNNDLVTIGKLASDLTKNCMSEEEKIKVLYKWVQLNIRYIAFLDGISGVKPDNAQDVVSKKYGDCKGMSNLLKSMLITQGFDARLAWVATSDIARDLDVTDPKPFANHMICALYADNQLCFLDATVESLALGEVPELLQGQTALIENGDSFEVVQIPKKDVYYNKDSLIVEYVISNNVLQGKAYRSFEGETKHVISYWINNMSIKDKNYEIKKFLKENNISDSINNINVTGLDTYLPKISLTYDTNKKSRINTFNDLIYLDLSETRDYDSAKIDLKKRKSALQYSYREYIVREVNCVIPKGYEVHDKLPDDFSIERDKYSFSINYEQKGDTIHRRKEIMIKTPILNTDDFAGWNEDIDALRKAYRQLLVLEKLTLKQ